MKLTKEQASSVISKFNNDKDKRRPCSLCGGNSWNLNNTIFELKEFTGTNMIIGGGISLFPVLVVTCNNCGNTLFLNAIKQGVIEPDKEEPQK